MEGHTCSLMLWSEGLTAPTCRCHRASGSTPNAMDCSRAASQSDPRPISAVSLIAAFFCDAIPTPAISCSIPHQGGSTADFKLATKLAPQSHMKWCSWCHSCTERSHLGVVYLEIGRMLTFMFASSLNLWANVPLAPTLHSMRELTCPSGLAPGAGWGVLNCWLCTNTGARSVSGSRGCSSSWRTLVSTS